MNIDIGHTVMRLIILGLLQIALVTAIWYGFKKIQKDNESNIPFKILLFILLLFVIRSICVTVIIWFCMHTEFGKIKAKELEENLD